jgi:2-polyprenyl-6-methoxyphenol hydroxylase-like FAD-dependent oxidoreductase
MPTPHSTNRLPLRTDVLIVGAGPAGLTLATSLRQLGVDHVLVDRQADVQPGSKAAAVQPRVLEYLQRIGVSERLVQAGERGRGFRLHDRVQTLMRASYDDLDTPYPFVLLASQQTTEEHLARRLEELGGTVFREHRFLGFIPDFSGVTATIAGSDGVLHAVEARYLVGCDGVYSTVRSAAGIAFPGDAPEQLFALADVRLSPGSEAAAPKDTTFFLSSAGMLLVSPIADGEHRIVASAAPGSAAPTAGDVRRLLAERGPRASGTQVTEMVAASTYGFQDRVAERFSEGPVFLVGDAAHTHSPAGGQGMNTGILDAGNLAWKLHAVLTGAAPAALLDSYHSERHPVAATLVAFTSQFAKLANLRDPAAGQRRNALLAAAAGAPGITEWIATKLSQLDVDYTLEPADGSPHVGERVSPTSVPAADLHWTLALPGQEGTEETGEQHGPLAIRHVPGLPTTLLVRPDGYLAAHSVPADPATVLDQLPQYMPSHSTR